MQVLVGAFNQEKALVGSFSVILKTDCEIDGSICGSTTFSVILKTDCEIDGSICCSTTQMCGRGWIGVRAEYDDDVCSSALTSALSTLSWVQRVQCSYRTLLVQHCIPPCISSICYSLSQFCGCQLWWCNTTHLVGYILHWQTYSIHWTFKCTCHI